VGCPLGSDVGTMEGILVGVPDGCLLGSPLG
jgi:hypothetical protein